MANRIWVYSTLTSSQKYTKWSSPPLGGLPAPIHEVLIDGGANVATNKLVTPRGVVTEITEEDYEHLKQNDVFKLHVNNGFITVRTEKVDPEVAVAKDMKQKDESAPVTPHDNLPGVTHAKK